MYVCVHARSVTSFVSDSLRPYGLHPARLLCQWDSPGKNTGVGCHAVLQGIFLTQGSNLDLPCLHVYVYVCVCMCIYMYMCVYSWNIYLGVLYLYIKYIYLVNIYMKYIYLGYLYAWSVYVCVILSLGKELRAIEACQTEAWSECVVWSGGESGMGICYYTPPSPFWRMAAKRI